MIPSTDLQVELWPARGPPGGQHVGVKVTHLSSGLVACANTGRSQHRNLQVAVNMILGGLTSPDYPG